MKGIFSHTRCSCYLIVDLKHFNRLAIFRICIHICAANNCQNIFIINFTFSFIQTHLLYTHTQTHTRNMNTLKYWGESLINTAIYKIFELLLSWGESNKLNDKRSEICSKVHFNVFHL